jgi:hypothetical protein
VTIGHVGDPGCPVLTADGLGYPVIVRRVCGGRLLPCDHWTCWLSWLSCLDCRRGGGVGLPGRRPGLATAKINHFIS